MLEAGRSGGGADATAGAETRSESTGRGADAEDAGEEVLDSSSEPCGPTATSNSSISKMRPSAPPPIHRASHLLPGGREPASSSVRLQRTGPRSVPCPPAGAPPRDLS